MDEQKSQDTEALLDAVDILADVVDIDLSSNESVQKGEKTADALKEKFTVIHNYLRCQQSQKRRSETSPWSPIDYPACLGGSYKN